MGLKIEIEKKFCKFFIKKFNFFLISRLFFFWLMISKGRSFVLIVLYDPFRVGFIISLLFYKYLTPMGSFKFWRIFFKWTLCQFQRFMFNDVLILKYLTGDACYVLL